MHLKDSLCGKALLFYLSSACSLIKRNAKMLYFQLLKHGSLNNVIREFSKWPNHYGEPLYHGLTYKYGKRTPDFEFCIFWGRF